MMKINIPVATRRDVLRSAGIGFGHLALSGLLGSLAKTASAAELAALNPLAPKRSPLPVKAKRIIFLFMEGAMSTVDTFEYKPEMAKRNGQSGPGGGTITGSKFRFNQYGNSGAWFSELLPNIATHADELCWVRGLYTDTPAHPQAVVQLHTGSANASLTRPSWGSWLLYGLGTENQDLPGYITINPPVAFGGAANYGSAFLPAYYQGTAITDQGYMPNIEAATTRDLERQQINLIQDLNHELAAQPGAPEAVDGVIKSYELAFRMQDSVPALLDISKEPRHVRETYGVKAGLEGSFARQCLMARRLSEAGVRFVEIRQPGWDHPVPLHTEFHAIVDGTSGDTHLKPVRASFLHSSLIANGSVIRMSKGKGHDIELKVTVDKGRIEDLLRLEVRTEPAVMKRRGADENPFEPSPRGR